MTAQAPSLDTLERWMQAVVMHPDGVNPGLRAAGAKGLLPQAVKDPGSVVMPSQKLGSLDRLDIYAHMYHARLFEVMENEYPTTLQILGREPFQDACRAYLRKHPSRSRTLNSLSEKFPAFLSRHLARSPRNAFAADVARIERAMEEVFDERRAEPLTVPEVAAIAAAEWERLRLGVNPALRFLELRYPANAYMNALRTKGRARIPRRKACCVIVFRRGFQVYRRDQDPVQFRLLQALAAGKTLGQAVRASVARRKGSADRLAALLGGWFKDWASFGLFVR